MFSPFKALLERILVINPVGRLTIAEVHAELLDMHS